MKNFLLDMRKYFLIMSNFYLFEILNKPNSLTIVKSKKILKMSNYVLILNIFFLIMRIRNLQCGLSKVSPLLIYSLCDHEIFQRRMWPWNIPKTYTVEKYLKLFWSAFSRIRTAYGEIVRISLNSVRMRENADKNNSK